MRKRNPIYKWIGCWRLTQRICLTKSVCNYIAVHVYGEREARAGEEYVHGETTFVFIYVSESLSSLFRVLRENQSTLTRHCSMPAIRQTHAKQISLYWDCYVTALPSRHGRHVGWICVPIYTVWAWSDFYLDSTARNAAMHYSSALYFASRRGSIFVLSFSH